MGCCGSTPPIPDKEPVQSESKPVPSQPTKPKEQIHEKPKIDPKPTPIQPVATTSPSENNPPPEPEPTKPDIIVPDPIPEKKEEEVKEAISKLVIEPPEPTPQLLQVDGFYSPTSRKSIVKQGKRRSEIRAQIREFRRQWKESQARLEDLGEIEEAKTLYAIKTGEDALQIFRSLFEVDSVWTGIAEWESDGTSLGLEFTVLSSPDEEGQFSVSRLYHVARGRSRRVDNVRIYEETVLIDREYTEQLVFEYKEETPEGLELLLECRARHKDNKIHLKRTYVQGIAKKRKMDETEYEEGRFDFVRTYHKQAGKFIKQSSIDFDDAASSRENSREDSAVHVTQRMARYSEQFSREVTTGRSSVLPNIESLGKDVDVLLSGEEIAESPSASSHTFY